MSNIIITTRRNQAPKAAFIKIVTVLALLMLGSTLWAEDSQKVD